MPLIMPCAVCRRSFKASDLYWLEIEPPHYIDLPEDAKHVDQRDDGDEPVISLQYCGECIAETETPPLESVADENPPKPYAP